MPNFSPVTELFTAIEAAETVAEKSDLAIQLTQALIGNLWMFDLKNILGRRFVEADALNDNLAETIELFKSPKDLMLAFCTTLHFVPVKPGYKFELSNDHRLAETETVLMAQRDAQNVLLPLHNLFLLLDGKPMVYLASGDFDSLLEKPDLSHCFDMILDVQQDELDRVLEQQRALPYFELSQAETHHNHKLITFTRPDLLEKLNNELARTDFHLGQQMFDFLIKGKHGEAFSEKVFNSYMEKYSLAA